MNNKSYLELLKSPEWADKRYKIFKRDSFKCVKCSSKENIQCHHKIYIKGKLPWEINDKHLITLCQNCHEKEHANRHISTFFIKPKKKPKLKRKKIITIKKCRYTGQLLYITKKEKLNKQ